MTSVFRTVLLKRWPLWVVGLAILGLIATSSVACSTAQSNKLEVATSTTLLAYITQQVGGDKVDVLNIVPASQHPGNFDAKPSDIEKLQKASLFLVHGFPGETFVPGLVQSANNPNLKLVTISENGSWMTPEVQLAATDRVAAILGEADPANKDFYAQQASEYEARVRAKEADVKSKLAQVDVSSLTAIASVFQAPFASWAGIGVVGTYMPAESLTPQVVKDLVDTGKAKGVNLIIDNVHSGADAGKGLAEELSAKRIVLVYFPGGLPNTDTWEKAIDYDVDQILQMLGK